MGEILDVFGNCVGHQLTNPGPGYVERLGRAVTRGESTFDINVGSNMNEQEDLEMSLSRTVVLRGRHDGTCEPKRVHCARPV